MCVCISFALNITKYIGRKCEMHFSNSGEQFQVECFMECYIELWPQTMGNLFCRFYGLKIGKWRCAYVQMAMLILCEIKHIWICTPLLANVGRCSPLKWSDLALSLSLSLCNIHGPMIFLFIYNYSLISEFPWIVYITEF